MGCTGPSPRTSETCYAGGRPRVSDSAGLGVGPKTAFLTGFWVLLLLLGGGTPL